MSAEELKVIAYVLYTVGFVITFAVTVLYTVVAPWKRTPSGRYMFTLLLSLTLVLGNSVVRVFFRDWSPGLVIAIVVFMFFIVAITAMGIGIYNASIKRYLDIKINKIKAK